MKKIFNNLINKQIFITNTCLFIFIVFLLFQAFLFGGELDYLIFEYTTPQSFKIIESFYKPFIKVQKIFKLTSTENNSALLIALYERYGEYKKAENLIKQDIQNNSSLEQVQAFSHLVYYNISRLEYNKAELSIKKATKILSTDFQKSNKNKFFMTNLNTSLGLVYQRIGRLEPAEELYKEALQVKNYENQVTLLNMLGNLYIQKKNYIEAEKLLLQALSLSLKNTVKHNQEIQLVTTCNNLGILYKNKKDFLNSAKYFNQAISLTQNKSSYTNKSLFAKSINNLGMLYFELKDYTKAKKLVEASITIQRKIDGNLNNVEDICRIKNLSKIYKAQNNDKKVYKLDKEFNTLIYKNFNSTLNYPNFLNKVNLFCSNNLGGI